MFSGVIYLDQGPLVKLSHNHFWLPRLASNTSGVASLFGPVTFVVEFSFDVFVIAFSF